MNDPELKKEIRGRTLELRAYGIEKTLLDKLEVKLIRLFNQTHYYETTVFGRVRKKLRKPQKIAMANALIDRMLDGEIDVDRDSISQVKLMDSEG